MKTISFLIGASSGLAFMFAVSTLGTDEPKILKENDAVCLFNKEADTAEIRLSSGFVFERATELREIPDNVHKQDLSFSKRFLVKESEGTCSVSYNASDIIVPLASIQQ